VNLRNNILHTLTIFSSVGTLVCCALPALLVSIGAGAVMASLVSAVPQLVWISEHKIPLFVFAGLMLCLSGFATYCNRRPMRHLQNRVCVCGGFPWGCLSYRWRFTPLDSTSRFSQVSRGKSSAADF